MKLINTIMVIFTLFNISCSTKNHSQIDKGVERRYDRLFEKKNQAPVDIKSNVTTSEVKIDLTFLETLTDVNVLIYGVGGTEIAGSSYSSFKNVFLKNETKALKLKLDKFQDGSYIVVSITGSLKKIKTAKVTTIPVGVVENRTLRVNPYKKSNGKVHSSQKVSTNELGQKFIVSKI